MVRSALGSELAETIFINIHTVVTKRGGQKGKGRIPSNKSWYIAVRELNLIPIERLLNKYLSTGEGKGKDPKNKGNTGSYVGRWGLG